MHGGVRNSGKFMAIRIIVPEDFSIEILWNWVLIPGRGKDCSRMIEKAYINTCSLLAWSISFYSIVKLIWAVCYGHSLLQYLLIRWLPLSVAVLRRLCSLFIFTLQNWSSLMFALFPNIVNAAYTASISASNSVSSSLLPLQAWGKQRDHNHHSCVHRLNASSRIWHKSLRAKRCICFCSAQLCIFQAL